jgi:hypothetical protein
MPANGLPTMSGVNNQLSGDSNVAAAYNTPPAIRRSP